MYGLIGTMLAMPGKREELLAIMLDPTEALPGCPSYATARDGPLEHGIWAGPG